MPEEINYERLASQLWSRIWERCIIDGCCYGFDKTKEPEEECVWCGTPRKATGTLGLNSLLAEIDYPRQRFFMSGQSYELLHSNGSDFERLLDNKTLFGLPIVLDDTIPTSEIQIRQDGKIIGRIASVTFWG